MVRVKNRYLLVNVLYPSSSPSPAPAQHASAPTSAPTSAPLPDIVHFRRPTPDGVTAPLLLNEIRTQISLLYGDYGAGMSGAGLAVKYFSPATSTLILRCPRAHFRIVWAVLALMTHLPSAAKGRGREGGTECVMRVVRVSGTVRKIEEELIVRARREILRAKGEAGLEGAGAGDLLDAILGSEEDGEEEDA